MPRSGANPSSFGDIEDLRSLLEQAPVGLVAAEADSGHVVIFNEEAARILGHPPPRSAHAADFATFGSFHADGTPFGPAEHPLVRALAGEIVRGETVRCRRADGELVCLSVNASPLRSPGGPVRGAVAIFVELAASEAERRERSRPVPAADGRSRETEERAGEIDRPHATARAFSEGLEEKVQLAYQAQHDPLTGLPNRVLFEERLERAVASAERYGRKLALLLLDLDDFAFVNDAFGHDAGDRVLKDVARRLQAKLRRSDTLARHGGDEFIVLVSEIGESSDAREVALALVSSMIEPFEVPGNRVVLTASVGVSIFPDDARDSGELKRHADAAMYHAQEPGSNGISVYGSPDRFELFASELYRSR